MSLPSFILALGLVLPIAAAETTFTPLFNGRDLSGWVNVNCAPETFTVRDGMIHCDGIPTGALRTERQYENFILELEWRHLKPGGNAGVFIWSGPLPAIGQPFLRAIEVQVLDHGYGHSDWFTTHGDIFPIHGSRMKPIGPSRGDRSFPSAHLSKGTPEWNKYRIEARNGVLHLAVNGTVVSGGTDCSWRKGYIALESEGGIVDWRNLRILELPSTQPAATDSAPDAEPWTCLYDGRSLRGWETPENVVGIWKPSDWVLRARTAAILWHSTRLDSGRIFLDWKWPAKPSSPVPPIVLQAPGSDTLITLPPQPAAPLDGWYPIEHPRTRTTAQIHLNHQSVGTLPLPAGPLRFGIQSPASGIDISSPFHIQDR